MHDQGHQPRRGRGGAQRPKVELTLHPTPPDTGIVLRRTEALLGRPYSISGHVIHGRKLGRDLGFRTLNLRFAHARSAAAGVFVVQVHGLADSPLPAVASLGVRPTVEDAGQLLREVHCLAWPAELGPEAGYGRCVRVDLLGKLHDERKYESLQELREGIARDTAEARRWWGERGAPP